MLAMTTICGSEISHVLSPPPPRTNQIPRTRLLRATSFKYDMTSKLATESKPLVGSSRKRILGQVISWLAMLTRRFSPPLRPLRTGVPMMVLACSIKPKECSRPSTRRLRSALVTVLQ